MERNDLRRIREIFREGKNKLLSLSELVKNLSSFIDSHNELIQAYRLVRLDRLSNQISNPLASESFIGNGSRSLGILPYFPLSILEGMIGSMEHTLSRYIQKMFQILRNFDELASKISIIPSKVNLDNRLTSLPDNYVGTPNIDPRSLNTSVSSYNVRHWDESMSIGYSLTSVLLFLIGWAKKTIYTVFYLLQESSLGCRFFFDSELFSVSACVPYFSEESTARIRKHCNKVGLSEHDSMFLSDHTQDCLQHNHILPNVGFTKVSEKEDTTIFDSLSGVPNISIPDGLRFFSEKFIEIWEASCREYLSNEAHMFLSQKAI